ncbi:dynein regulatory complex subunit 2, partial [Porphyrio hochstetteri]
GPGPRASPPRPSHPCVCPAAMPGKRRSLRAAAPAAGEDGLLPSRAPAEEEAAATKREILTLFLKDKLAREECDSTLNLHKLSTQWRAVLRETKDKELHRDITILSQTFARVMDCKDSAIQSLAMDLEEAEEQHAQALRSHLHNIDRLLQLQHSRLSCLEEGYSTQLDALKMEFEAERRTILEQQEQESCYLQDMELAAEQDSIRSDHEVTLNFQSTRDDIKNKSLQKQQCTRMELSRKVEELWEQFQQAIQSYTEATEDQKVTYEALKQKDKKNSREIEMQAKKLQKLQSLITATKGRITSHLQESKEQSRCAREEKDKVLRQLQELKSQMNQARVKAHSDLAGLSLQSSAALKVLTRVVKKAQRILRLAEMCRGLETEEEKVLPFYSSSLVEEEQQESQRVLEETPTEPLAQAMWDSVGLERFWQRFSKVKLEEKVLEKEQEALSQRNQQLRDLLRQYLEGISVIWEELGDHNPFLIVKHKSCIPRELPGARGTLCMRSARSHTPQQPPGPCSTSTS